MQEWERGMFTITYSERHLMPAVLKDSITVYKQFKAEQRATKK